MQIEEQYFRRNQFSMHLLFMSGEIHHTVITSNETEHAVMNTPII